MQFMMESIFILVRKAVQIDENSKIEAHRTGRLKGDIKMRNSRRWLAAILAGAMIAVTGCAGNTASKQETTAAQTTAAETTAEETTAAKTTAEAKEGETTTFVDDLGREVELELPITRACVANRYNNELIRAVGAGDAVVGVDQYTSQDPVYWPQFGEDETFGKDEYDYEKIVALDPQVLVVPKNGKVEESVDKLESFGIKVVVITGWDNSDVPKQIRLCGELFGKQEQAEELVDVVDLRQLCRRELHGALVQPRLLFSDTANSSRGEAAPSRWSQRRLFKAKAPENRERFFLASFGINFTGNLIGNAVLRLRPFTFACMVRHRRKRKCRETNAVIHDKAAVPRALINVRLTGQFFILVDAMNTFTP